MGCNSSPTYLSAEVGDIILAQPAIAVVGSNRRGWLSSRRTSILAVQNDKRMLQYKYVTYTIFWFSRKLNRPVKILATKATTTTAGLVILCSNTKIYLLLDREGCNEFEYTDEKFSTRRIQ